MTEPKTYTTPAGRALTDADLDAIAEEVERTDYDVEQLKTRRRGGHFWDPRRLRSFPSASILSSRVPSKRAEAALSTSEIIRRALRHYLDVA